MVTPYKNVNKIKRVRAYRQMVQIQEEMSTEFHVNFYWGYATHLL